MDIRVPQFILEKYEHKDIFNFSNEKHGGYLIITYPYWVAYTCSPESDTWIRVIPEINCQYKTIEPVCENSNNRHEECCEAQFSFTYDLPSNDFDTEETQKFFSSIPEEAKILTTYFKESHWEVINTYIILGDDFKKLVESNSAMAYLIINFGNLNYAYQFQGEIALLRKLISKRQRDILKMAGLPQEESIRKIFSKIDLRGISEKQFIRFCKTFPTSRKSSNKLYKFLSHVRLINYQLLIIISEYRYLIHVLPKSTIINLVKSKRFNYHVSILKKIYYRCRKWNIHFPQIILLNNISIIDKNNLEKIKQKKVLQEKFPTPPIKGTDSIIPIRDLKGLRSWSRGQSNCIRHSWKDVVKKKSYFYMVQFLGENATLEIIYLQEDPKMGSLLGARNKRVSKLLRSHVNNWYRENI